ncbi:hypothetical protein EXIGLDRAFT_669577 [Exidia glandulosa HHB12029]|uniref:Carbohydrate esterase family 16 protein n=1 Tax=Exidia glandulosa HHB12029 TaxID=1314781 RepID=A0A165LS91_EXIGL|nr:hypothetical protein EXIGLDRAFT_669577 [Exidia glandulosa HHB12029]
MLSPVTICALASYALLSGATPTGFWFSFGDSYTQTQFNYTLAQPSDSNPLGNPDLPGSTACGSVPNWVYWDVMKYNSSERFAFNFAWGGATINASIVPPPSPEILSVIEQIDEFQAGYVGDSPLNNIAWTGDNTLFSTFIGINDIGGSYQSASNQSTINSQLMDSYFNEMERLYGYGGRNFLFLNVPPTDRSPLIMTVSAEDQAKYKAAVQDYNSQLAARVAGLVAAHTDVQAWVVDTNSVVAQLLDNPTQFGFQDATSFGDGDTFIWCNNYHISPAAHEYVARAVQSSLSGTGLI